MASGRDCCPVGDERIDHASRIASWGTSFRQLLAELRLVEAFGLVMCSRHTLQEIAFDCGFQSPPASASQNFRHFFGMSPSELRASQEKQGV